LSVSQVSWSGRSSALPRKTTTLRSNWTNVGAGGAGGPINTETCGLGKKTCIFESQRKSSGVGSAGPAAGTAPPAVPPATSIVACAGFEPVFLAEAEPGIIPDLPTSRSTT
jgi:hypothetical protein